MAISKNIYDPQEFKLAVIAETTVGTANTTTMQLLNVTDLISMSREVTQVLEPRTGRSGRIQRQEDVYTNDSGSRRTTVTAPIIMDTTVDTLLFENAIGIETDVEPASIILSSTYSPTEMEHDDTGIDDNIHALTVALISPETDESIIIPGCCVTELTPSMDMGTENGRRMATVTFTSFYRPADGQSAPTGLVDYGSTFRYLYNLNAEKTINDVDVVLSRFEFTIANPLNVNGFQGSNGDPEVMTRGIPKVTVTGTAGIKYDANTASLWEKFCAGTSVDVLLADNATWGSATFGIQAYDGFITSDPSLTGTENGVFQDVSFEFTAEDDGKVIEIIP